MKKGLIIFDIDGTIIDSPEQKLPTDKMISVFEKTQEHYYLSPATGRSWSFAKTIIQTLGIIHPCIVAGGTQIRTSFGEVLWQANIPHNALGQALNMLSQYSKHSIIYNDSTEDEYLQDRGIKAHEVDIKEPIYFLECIFVPNEDAELLQKNLNAIPGLICSMVNAQRPNTKDLHITRNDATKEHAIARLLDILSVKKEDTIGIGDGYNDLHLFSAVNTKIAVGNAVPELKSASTLIIGTVYEDGVADYLKTLC